MSKKKQQPVAESPETARKPSLMGDELAEQRRYIESLQRSRAVDLKGQRDHIARMGERAGTLGIVDEAKFVESMRDVGYKSTAFAVAELIDNSMQAGASRVDVIVHCEKGETVSTIAVMDDGHGMDPLMLLESIRWGGTHRHGNRAGFGRFGMGKSSSCISQGRRLTSFSKTEDGSLHSVQLDLDQVAAEALKRESGGAVPPPDVNDEAARPLPAWVREYRQAQGLEAEITAGTVVIIDKLDRHDFKRRASLVDMLLRELGMIYRYYLDGIDLFVNGARVELVDPLFTLPGHRDPAAGDNAYRAEDRGTIRVDVKDPETGGLQGSIRVRFSWMHPHFARRDTKVGVTESNENKNFRMDILKRYNKGVHILRKGRVVDWLETRCPWRAFKNNDRYWGCEIDFEPALDEGFRVTNSKQQVVPSDRIWKILEDAGVKAELTKLAQEQDRLRDKLNAEAKRTKGEERRSITAVRAATEERGDNPGAGMSAEGRKRAEVATREEAKRKATAAGLPFEHVEAQVRKSVATRDWAVESRSDLPPGSPFFWAEMRIDAESQKSQIVVILNETHRFYTGVYCAVSQPGRDALEVLLFAIARHMAPAVTDDLRPGQFYRSELARWSNTLQDYLYELAEVPYEDSDLEGADEAEEVASGG